MSGRHKFSELRKSIESDPVRRKRMEEKREAEEVLTNLAGLRRKRGMTQAELARVLAVSQPNISNIEASTDKGQVLLDTLARYVEALGGTLELKASFPDHPEGGVAVNIVSPVKVPHEQDQEQISSSASSVRDTPVSREPRQRTQETRQNSGVSQPISPKDELREQRSFAQVDR